MPPSNKVFRSIYNVVLALLVLTLLSSFGLALAGRLAPDAAENLRHGDTFAQILVAQAPSALASATVPRHIIEQYKAYVVDLGNVAAQLSTIQTFYLSVISGLIAILAFKEANRPIEDYFGWVPIVVFIFIALVCATWFFTEQQFNNIVGAKFKVLRSMEDKYTDLYPMFTEQTNYYLANRLSGVIFHQLILVVIIGLGALILSASGIFWRLRHRRPTDDSG